MKQPNPWAPARRAWLLALVVALAEWGWRDLPSPWRWIAGVVSALGFAALIVLAAIGAEYLAAHPVPKPSISEDER